MYEYGVTYRVERESRNRHERGAMAAMMAAADDVTVGLLEYDPAGPRLSWVFPSRGEMDVGLIAARAQLLQPLASPAFVWSRHRGMWYYSLASKRATGLSLSLSIPLSASPLSLLTPSPSPTR